MRQGSQYHSESPSLKQRLLLLCERTHDTGLMRVANGTSPLDGSVLATERERRAWISTSLMNAYKQTGDGEVFALLFEINRDEFLYAVRACLRHVPASVDANDVLQEVFLSIYRYPGRFLADRAGAFRGWGHRIVRNTVLKLAKKQARQPISLIVDDEEHPCEDTRIPQPLRVVSEQESSGLVNDSYVLFLSLYLLHFRRLSPKEQRALTLAQVEGWSYREIADELGTCVANLKMMIYRSRRRICHGMAESLAELGRGEFSGSQTPAPARARARAGFRLGALGPPRTRGRRCQPPGGRGH
jgi:RNA polymerase sigma-70 factor (ECF subfamily)